MSSLPTILLIAPDPGDRATIAGMLEQHGHEVLQATSGLEARARMQSAGSELVIVLDLAASPDALRYLRGPAVTRGNAPVVCIADRRQVGSSSEALRLGIADLIGRPVRESDLLAAVANAREFARTMWERPGPPGTTPLSPDGMFGSSAAMREVLTLVRRVAPSRCTVLLIGERGTGREMVARGIHSQGPNHAAPFVKIACARAPADVDRQLERLVQGSAESGSTVYLENIHELASDQQRRLAEHIAATPTPPGDLLGSADLRFIGALVPRILDPAQRDQVRAELIDALGVVRIDLPPLRQRTEDIPLLAMHFLKEACIRNGVPPKALSRSALMLLAALPWPGNAAELRSLAERLAVLTARGTILLEDVLPNIRFDGAEALGRDRGTLREAREGFERDYIVTVLQHHHGRMGAAAADLGIERTNLYRKIKQLNITWTTGAG
jgi:two-component system nitrogen regulation response regulator NtrX